MRSTRIRQLLVGVAGVAAIAAPAALLGGGSKPVAAVTTASGQTQDEIQYLESSKATTVQYSPVSGSTASEAIQGGGGGCSAPTPVGVPILNFGGRLYTGTDGNGIENYTGSPSQGSAGIYKARTGVCSIPQDFSIENVTGTGAEGLDFSIGTNSLVANRLFTEALIALQRSDHLSTAVDVEMVEYLAGSQVANQCYSLPNTNAATEDTSQTNALGDSECSTQNTPVSTGFDTLEVRVLTPGGSVSVVGPTSTFLLANQICGGQQLGNPNTFQVTDNGQGCKTYTNFSYDAGNLTAEFDTFGSTLTHFAFTVNWIVPPDNNGNPCTPDGSNGNECKATQVTVNGVTAPQTYCQAASPAQPVCTTSRDYSYTADPGSTLITETYDSDVDISFHYP